MDELKRQLQSENVDERAAAAESFSLMGPDAAPAAVALVNACADDEAVNQWAVAALEEIGPPQPEAIDELRKLVASENSLVAYWAITLLGRAGKEANSCQVDLAAVLRDSSDMSVRERSAWALGKTNACSASAIEALKKAASSGQPARLARLASEALAQIHD